MEKKLFAAVIAVLAMVLTPAFVLAGGGGNETPGQAYFDQQFDRLQGSVAEVKGDTTQIVSILGNVFEGTVPKGGTLINLCNQHGWNLIVLMGHNGIENPDVVAAGECFEYPQTTEEFQAALRKGKPFYDAWLAKQSTTFRVNRVKVDTAEIDELNIRVANIKEKLAIKDMEVDQLKIRLAEITERLRVKKAEIEELNVKMAKFDQMNIDQLQIRDAKIENLEIEKMRIKDALIDKLRIKQLKIDNLEELLVQAQARCQELEARSPVVVEKPVPVAPGVASFRQDNDCGEPYFPSSWEWQFIEAAQKEGIVPVFWYINRQPEDVGGWLKVKIDYYDRDTKMCYTVWCQRYMPCTQSALPAVRQAGFTACDGVIVRDGGRYKTLLAGQVTNWPAGMVCLK